MRRSSVGLVVVGLLVVLLAYCQPARALNLDLGTFANTTFVNTTGNLDTASVNFVLVQGNLGVVGSNSYLQVTLTNTSTYATGWLNGDLLSGVLFQLNTTTTGPLATAYSAVTALALVNPGQCDASFIATCSSVSVDVSSQWLFQKSASGFATTGASGCAPAGTLSTAQYGIVTSQYGCLNPNFGGAGKDFVEPGAPVLYTGGGQLPFSIAGANYTQAAHGGASDTPYERTSVMFDLALGGTVTALTASNVMFTYGTNPDSSSGGKKVPEPGTIALFATGLAALGIFRRTKRKAGIR